MDKQPEALRLAELEAMHERGTIRRGHIDEMLTELRRLYALNQELLEALKLSEAALIKCFGAHANGEGDRHRALAAIRAAITKAEGEQK